MSSLKDLFGFGTAAEVSIALDGNPDPCPDAADPTSTTRAMIRHPMDKARELPLFQQHEGVRGVLQIAVPSGKTLEYQRITLEMRGVIEMIHDANARASAAYEFATLQREVEASSGVIDQDVRYKFDFSTVEKVYESYAGKTVRLRYVLKATIERAYAKNIVQEQEIWVQCLGVAPTINNTIKMEVGIEDCLQIEFEYNRSKYHLKDVVIGKVFFLLVRIKIKHMELGILRREIVRSGKEKHSESETMAKFELMDGAPIKGESIPVRLYLAPYALTPTYRNLQNQFSVKYFLNLVLVDEEDRRYFKQQEITLWRKVIG